MNRKWTAARNSGALGDVWRSETHLQETTGRISALFHLESPKTKDVIP